MRGKTGLALRRLSGHCTVTSEGVMAWYRLAPQGWSFRPDSAAREHQAVPRQSMGACPRRERARSASRGAEHLRADQMHLARRSMADEEVFVGVSIPDARRVLRLAA